MLSPVEITPWHWAGFIACVIFFLALDLGVFHREARVVRVREAMGWSFLWFSLAMAFAGLIKATRPRGEAIEFVTGYLIELSLSMDNVFVIALIFEHLKIPLIYQHRVLFWGILGALVMRGLMIGIGAQLVERYHWILLVFGAFLVFTGLKMLFSSAAEKEAEVESVITKWLRRHFPVTDQFHEQHFAVRIGGQWVLTPLAIALVLVETTDLIFAVDSIPAIFAITADPFLVFTSNVFAILCLRSLYFGLAGLIARFRHLKVSLAIVLTIVGVKMLGGKAIRDFLGDNSNLILLAVIFIVLIGGGVTSWIADRGKTREG